MSAITAKASRKMKKYAVLTREPRCFLGSFDFSWEQRKAIDIADYSKGNGYSKGDLADAGTPIILYGRLYTKYQFAISEVDTFAVPRNGAVYSQGNEVIVPASGETAEDIARASAVEKSGVLLGGDLNILRPFDFMNPLFLALAISNGEPQKELAKKAQGKSVVHIHNTDIQEVTIAYPSKTEQDRIVSVFRQLDNLITLHQRKFEKLTNVKKSMLEKMFPQNGSSYPEIRFKGFTDPWEQRKFEEIAVRSSVICSDDTLPRVEYEDIVSGTGRLNKDIYAKQSSKSGIAFHQGDVLYGKLRPYLQNWLLPTFDGLAVGDFWVLQPQNADSSFLYRLIQSRQFDEVANQSTGTKMPRADWKLVSKTVFSIPSNISEQAAIGTYFTALDSLITLHQRQPFLRSPPDISLIVQLTPPFYTFSWEQRKLASLCEKFTDGDWIESKDQSDFGVRLVQTGNVGVAEYLDKTNNKKWISEDTFDRLHCEEVLPGDILISRLPEPAGRACIVPLLGTKMITAVDCTIVRTAPDMSNKFLVQYLSSQAYFDDVNTCLAGGTRQRISRGNLANFNVPIPVKKSEQDAIGMFFGYLDNLITLHQRELEKLQNIKKSMLEKMFV